MKLLVTGGAGFIGSNFIRYWFKKYPNDFIINLDKLTYAGNLSSTKDFADNPNYTFVKGDILDKKIVDKVMQEVDVVVHFAAESHVDRSIEGPSVFVQTNIVGTQVLLESALKHKIKRFHFVSTDEVFGSLDLNTNEKFSETTRYAPNSPYSASKAGADYLVRSYFITFGLPVSVTNTSNNFGPYQSPEKFIPRMVTNLIEGKKLPVYGDGKNVRDWIYVEDHCRAIDLVINKGNPGSYYVVGGMTDDVTNLDIVKKLINLFDLDDSFITFVKDRKGHDRKYAVDWTKINKELGWAPQYSFDEYLSKTVDWYKENDWWWRPLKKEVENFYKKL
ncbi:MAG TPA: dTDP-glucose 4,6-dehydratase [candidate division WWE3 bacterium]|uniref:dTDP-glucose 4,6-dehydratase n=1 Tax=candidate division WWE3 bacterium TaxID=2053526 RepID=A0A7V5MH73_UNCKA|nr:dTDP-glucose 4,6-dehydratase [candidate division WWE3 bacterium]